MKRVFFIVGLVVLALSLKAQVSEQEFHALKALYNATGGDNWTNRTGWENINTTATKNDITTSWHGISTITEGHVTNLSFYGNNLTGSIPDEIGNLPYLTYLNFGNNNLEGPLPQSLKNLTKLYAFAISQCKINGPFPSELFLNCPLLRFFYAAGCGLTGTVPDVFGSTPLLQDFWIYNNQLEGELPPSINKLNLSDLSCSNNKFTGALPTLDSCKITYRLDFSSNKFSGAIPESYGNLKNLQSLNLRFNNLSGIIPDGFFTSNFSTLYLYNNFFSFEGLEPIFEKINGILYKDYTTSKLFPLLQQEISYDENETLTLNASTLSVYNLGGNNNHYKWFRDNVEVYSGSSPVYSLPSVSSANAGTYRFEVTNTVVTDLILKSENILVKTVHVNQLPTNITLENFTGTIGSLSATDPDANDTHTFALVTGDGTTNKDNNKFSISGNQLTINTKVDYELTKTLNILIGVNDGNGGTLSKAFTISVNNINEAPVFIGQVTSKTIDETAVNGSTVLNLTAQDPESDPITFTITQGNENGAFGIKGDLLIVKDSTKFNFNVKNSYSLTVSASDGMLSSTAALTINLNNINRLPLIEDATFTIDENSPTGTVVGVITASDPDGDPVTISILTGNELSAFSVSGKSIQVTNADALDFETNPVFNLTINVTDGIANVQATMTIKLKDILELTGNDILTFSVPGMMSNLEIDNVAHTIQVTVISPDLSGLIATFTLSPGASSIPTSGTALDFSSPQTIAVTSQSGDSQSWLVTVTFLVGKSEFDNRTINVYPNPTADFLKITGLLSNDDVKLITLTGEVLLQITPLNEMEEINLQNFKQGTYFIVVESNLIRKVQKIIKL
jgi:hypothetical protein